MDPKDCELSEIITKPIMVEPSKTILKIREILLEKGIKRVIIIDEKKPIGVITEKDIAKRIYKSGNKSIKEIKAKNFIPKKLFTLSKENTVQECAKMMKKHRINSVIIIDKEKKLKGVITKTDLVKVYLTKKMTPVKISKIMKSKLFTASPSDPILQIESLLLKYGISRIIIKRNQKPVGIITFRDFVPAKIPQWIADTADPKEVQEYKFKKGLKEMQTNQMSYLFPFHATDIMVPNPITVEADKDVKKAITLMIKHNVGGLPVVKNSKLVGIITKSDIVNSLTV